MSDPLLLLAVDQRPWLTDALFGHTHAVNARERAFTTEAKNMVLEGLISARERGDVHGAGILVDAELGPGVAERATNAGVRLAIPVELAGQRLYVTEPADLANHIAHFDPELVKVLVRYNPGDSADDRAVQRTRLAEVSQSAASAGKRFLFELLVPPTAEQAVDLAAFEADRPRLTREAMREIAAEVSVDVWKLEPQGDQTGYEEANALATELGGTCVLLGAGRPLQEVTEWISKAARAGFEGFAVGRTIWWDAIEAYRADQTTRPAGVGQIAGRYLQCVDAFRQAVV